MGIQSKRQLKLELVTIQVSISPTFKPLSHVPSSIGDINKRSLDLQRKVDGLRSVKESSRQRQSAVRIKKQSLRISGTQPSL